MRPPISVWIVAIVILFWAVLETYFALGAWRFLVPVSMGGHATVSAEDQAKMGYFVWVFIPSALIQLVCGIFILKGANWARILWSVWFVAKLILDEILHQNVLNWVWIAIFAVMIVLLFLPRANAYFMRGRAAA